MRMLTDQVIVVTGGTQGLGEDIAQRAAEHHAAGLVICGRSEKNGRRVADAISASGCPTVFVQADLASLDDCLSLIHI